MSTSAWWGKSEPELRSLYEWIDLQQHGANNVRGGIVGAVMGGGWGILGGLMGILAGGFQINPAISVGIPIAVGAALSIGTIAWYIRGKSDAEKRASRAVAEMRGFYWKLLHARWQGNIAGLMGEAEAKTLNNAAREYLRCRSTLRSPAWASVDSNSPWAKVRETTTSAMDIAMARIVTLIGQGIQPEDPSVQALLQDMRTAAEETAATANRLAGHRGLPGDASNELRKALEDLKALNDADEEYVELTREI